MNPDTALLVPPSRREMEIAALLLQRWSDKEIAQKLGMAIGTVRKHLDRMREKSGLHDRRALGQWALRMAAEMGVSVIVTDTGSMDSAQP